MPSKSSKRENPWLNIGFNLIIPILLLTKGKSWFDAPAWVLLVVALAFPVGYFFYDLKTRGKQNAFSIIGVISVMLTGGIGLLKLPPEAFLIKETLMPLVIGVAIAISAFTSKPAFKFIFYNEDIVNVPKIDAHLDTAEKQKAFLQMLKKATLVFAASSLVTALVNFIVTSLVVTADPRVNEDLFNEQIGKQTGITFVVLTICSLPFMFWSLNIVMKGLKQLIGIEIEEIFHMSEEKPAKASEES